MSATTVPAAPPVAREVARPGTSFAVLVALAAVAQFMVVLDSSIVNVALPSMRAALHLSPSAQQWVVNSYLITFGGLLLLAARAGDLLGRRRVFLAGLVVFTLASVLGGLAVNPAMLLTARILQGAGAAALGPASLSLITAGAPDDERRARGLTAWGIAASGAGAAGLVLGGVLTAGLSWRWVMFVNVPVGVALLAAAAVILLPAGPRTGGSADGRAALDLPGALTVTAGVSAVAYGISAAPGRGWGSVPVLAALAGGVVLLAAFILIERRAASPLVPRGIFAAGPNVAAANILMGLLGVVITAPMFFLSLYLQQVLGQSALRTGLSMLPLAAVLMAGVAVSKRLLPVLGTRSLIIAGALVSAAGLAWLSGLPASSHYVTHILGPGLLLSAGMSVLLLPVTHAATTGISPRDAGVASGLVNMGRQLGGALGLAVLVTVASTAAGHGGLPAGAGVLHGYRIALLVVAGLAVVLATVATRVRPAGAGS